MDFIIFFICVPLVHSASHTFITTYTEINEETFAEIPEISSVSTLDGEQIDYYDREEKKLILKQSWRVSTEMWKQYNNIREQVHKTNKINIHYLMNKFKHFHGVHTYKRIYGCDWDEGTGHSNWFDRHSYDGLGFISLDVENNRYIASVPEALNIVTRWNNDTAQLNYLGRYYRDGCVHWMMYFLRSKKVDLERKGPIKTALMYVIYTFIAILLLLVVLNIGAKVCLDKISEIIRIWKNR